MGEIPSAAQRRGGAPLVRLVRFLSCFTYGILPRGGGPAGIPFPGGPAIRTAYAATPRASERVPAGAPGAGMAATVASGPPPAARQRRGGPGLAGHPRRGVHRVLPRRLHPRLLQTGLGTLPSTRLSYSRPGAARLPPPDPALPLPARSFSYALQKRMPEAAVPGTFRAARERIADLRGAPVPLRRIEEILRDAPEDFDTFYARRTPEPGSHTGSIPGAAADGTGIALSKPEGAQRSVRRPTGQKANRQKRATVAAGFPPAPWMGTPEQAVESLFGPNRSVICGFRGM